MAIGSSLTRDVTGTPMQLPKYIDKFWTVLNQLKCTTVTERVIKSYMVILRYSAFISETNVIQICFSYIVYTAIVCSTLFYYNYTVTIQ